MMVSNIPWNISANNFNKNSKTIYYTNGILILQGKTFEVRILYGSISSNITSSVLWLLK